MTVVATAEVVTIILVGAVVPGVAVADGGCNGRGGCCGRCCTLCGLTYYSFRFLFLYIFCGFE